MHSVIMNEQVLVKGGKKGKKCVLKTKGLERIKLGVNKSRTTGWKKGNKSLKLTKWGLFYLWDV